jgi:uncharacterized protein YjiS (DUF1127 family)
MSSISIFRRSHSPRRSLRARIAAWLELRRTRASLAQLDDHLLADIGLTRNSALYEAMRPFWHE